MPISFRCSNVCSVFLNDPPTLDATLCAMSIHNTFEHLLLDRIRTVMVTAIDSNALFNVSFG